MSCDDYCTNHGCNRGPSCPAGTGCHGMPGCKDTDCPGRPAKVAKVKQRAPKHPGPLRRSEHWRIYLRYLAKWMLLVLAVMTLTPMVVSLALARAKEPPATDCRALIAAWRHDAPAHIRMKCDAR